MPSDRGARFNAIVDQLCAHLEYLRDEGVVSVQLAELPDFGVPGATRARAVPPPPISSSVPPAPRPAGADLAKAKNDLAAVTQAVAACKLCSLSKTRTRVVPGQGHLQPDILFIGEAPGEDEDRQGLAFVGRAGQLLTKMIEAMGYRREDVFIANILKCRPPGNRKPAPEEMQACRPYLERQIELLQPRVIITLGATALEGLFNQEMIRITKVRGNWMSWNDIPVMPTFHPSYLLRNESAKKDVWRDLQEVLKKLGRTPPARQPPPD